LAAVPAPKPRLAQFLAPEVQADLVGVADESTRSIVTIRGDGLFPPGSSMVRPEVLPILGRIAAAVQAVPGQVVVTGHTDNQPIRSARFPSNWHLSQERALLVALLLAERGVPRERMRSEGRGDAQPIAANDAPGDRAQNRRVEITLLLPRAE
jgi:type VI secretion system protein ImpK